MSRFFFRNRFYFPILFFAGITLIFASCENTRKNHATTSLSGNTVDVKYAEGFQIIDHGSYVEVKVTKPWPGSNLEFKYALVRQGKIDIDEKKFDAVVSIPVEKIVVTSTTHIPSLEELNELNTLIGFPGLDYISSEKTRVMIDDGKISEAGKNEDLNTEILLNLSPDAVVGFAVDGKNSTLTTLQKAGIPVLYNSDWTENSPLGKSEWIKFFGALYDKMDVADSIFKHIETEYLAAKELASKASSRPTVISGAMYRDVWYMPQGDSWGAQFITDANGDYLWNDSRGSGSLSLNLESVLEKGHEAEVWIGPGQFTSLREMKNASKVYTKFLAFKKGEVYSYNSKKGEKGGSVYFELAPNRPDLVLKDMIKMLHPELLPEHELYFFEKLY